MLSFKRRFGILVILSTIGYALSFGNQLVISYYFGTSSKLDAYWAALGIANFLCFYLHPLKEAIVPATFRSSMISMEDASDMLSAGITFLSLLVGISGWLMFIAPSILVDWLANPDQSDQQLLKLLPWFIPFVFLFSFSEILSSVLLGFNKNVTQAAARLVAGIASLVTLILLSQQFGIKALVISLLVNQLVVVLVSIWSLKSLKIKLKLVSIAILKKQNMFTLFSSLFFSYLIAQSYVLIERNTMMQLSDGLLSSYQYSTSLVNVLLSVIAFPFANLLWHKFLNAKHLNDTSGAHSILFRASYVLFLILLPICTFGYLNAKTIIFIIYSRGAFDIQSLQLTTEAFKATIFAAIPIGISSIIGRYLISSHHPKFLAITGVFTAVAGISIIGVSYFIKSVELIQWHWFFANLLGLGVCISFTVRSLAEVPLEASKGFNILLHSVILVLLTAFLTPDFTELNASKSQTLFLLCCNFIAYTTILSLFAKISGMFRKLGQVISPYAT